MYLYFVFRSSQILYFYFSHFPKTDFLYFICTISLNLISRNARWRIGKCPRRWKPWCNLGHNTKSPGRTFGGHPVWGVPRLTRVNDPSRGCLGCQISVPTQHYFFRWRQKSLSMRPLPLFLFIPLIYIGLFVLTAPIMH